MVHVLSLIHRVADLAGAGAFLESLGFVVVTAPGGAMVADNGSVRLRVEHAPSNGALRLEIPTFDPDAEATLLLEHEFVSIARPLARVRPDRAEIELAGPHGIHIVFSRDYDEDELGTLPDLPKTLLWDDDAEQLLKDVLKEVPLVFREVARARSTERAESLALQTGALKVDLQHAVDGVLDATPDFKREELEGVLRSLGASSRSPRPSAAGDYR